MKRSETFTLLIPDHLVGERLDLALSLLEPRLSRSQAQKLIKAGEVLLNNTTPRPRDLVKFNDEITLHLPIESQETTPIPQKIALDILHEDDAIIVLNKPAGMVVHPGAGNNEGTLVNALLHHHPPLSKLERAGIVHRLDKETSGVLVIAKSEEAEAALLEQFRERTPERLYNALVYGELISGTTINAPIGRNPYNRKRMMVTETDEDGYNEGREAITHLRVKERFRAHTLVEAYLETGRTHQIRVHMQYINYPIVGDSDYGARLRLPRKFGQHAENVLRGFKRQALHALSLGFIHPTTGEAVKFEAPYPQDLAQLIEAIRDESLQYAEENA